MALRITAGQTELITVPSCGGGVAALRWRGMDILRAAKAGFAHPTDLAEFPLAPFPNRIAHGCFDWQGRSIQLERPAEGGAHALHGIAWLRPWRVAEHTPSRLALILEAKASAAWPWDFRLERRFEVEEAGALFTLTLTALGPSPMPAGLGFHPYFPAAGAVVRLQTAMQIEATPALLPQRFARTRLCEALAQGVDAGGLDLDHAFAGWNGRAALAWPDRAIEIEADPALGFVHLYAPPGGGFFCLEPVSAMPDAVNWRGPEATGLRMLAPEDTLGVAMWLRFKA